MALQGWIDRIRSRSAHEEGQTMAEYAVVLGVITPVIVLAFAAFADEISKLIDTFSDYLLAI